MKKRIAAIVIFAMLLCLCACDGEKKPASTGSDLTWEEIEKLIEESE